MTGWEAKPLGEVCTIKPPKAEAKAKLADGDEVSFAPMEDLGIGEKYLQPRRTRRLGEVSGSYTYFADGDVLLAKITPCFENGKLGVARGLTNGVGFGSSEYIVLRPTPALDAEFLYYYLARPTFLEEGARTMTGAVGHKRVTKEFVEAYQIPLPPLAEQRRIVAILDETFEAIATAKANTEKNLHNSRELFKGYLEAIFTEGGASWVKRVLGDVCEFENGDRGTNYPNRSEYVESGIPWINTGHIRPDGSLSTEEMNFITREKFNTLRSGKIQPGDLVYCLRGATLGKTALVAPLTEGAVASSLVILRPSPHLDSRFLYFFLTSPPGQGLIRGFENGAAQPNLGAKSVARFPISVPPIAEQQRVAANLTKIWEATKCLAEVYERKVAAIERLKRSLLHQAFTGQLTAKSTDQQVAEVA